MNKFFKFLIIPILHYSRRIITILKQPLPPTSPHDLYVKEQTEASYNHFKKYFKDAILLKNAKEIRKYAIKKAMENDKNLENFYLEFGVFKGKTISFFHEIIKKNIFGFDSFEGLREDWKGHNLEKGYGDQKGMVPKLHKDIVLIKGWVQDTVPKFLKEKKPKINFVHIDLDTYESSKFVLENLKPFLSKGCIILFDELYNFSGWDVGEYKALSETFSENEYKFLSFSAGTQVCIQIS